ncbi:MAG: CHAT domain-containing protein, partial [Methylocella sp.]
LDPTPEAGTSDSDAEQSREAATRLLALPWELLHDGDSFLFQGARPTRVRRRLPNTRVLDIPVVATPIRILLISARPEDESCGYIDHRMSAIPLVDAMEALGGLVQLRLLDPPTLPALRKELDRARREREAYQVLHFDGHGVYDRRIGLGGLCFEDPDDGNKLEYRRHKTIYTDELGPLLKDHRIPLVFLEACQSAQAEQASESVASELLKVGVASVVAMSHSVLVETARRFVQAFYAALARGARVGDAMLEGQRSLKDDSLRGHIFGAGELRLEDWFVPVLFQEKDDPQLFRAIPSKQTTADIKADLEARLGETPDTPATGFIGRSRELLALQRLLRLKPYAVLRGQGGEGKTALACEFARWLLRSQQIERTAFVSVESHNTLAAVLDALGHQLLGKHYSVATHSDLEQATREIERALNEQETLLVLDNLESLLPLPFVDSSAILDQHAREELDAILKLCARLNQRAATRLLFTSREALPSPFADHTLELHQMTREDAVKLIERVLHKENAGAAIDEASREAIENLVDAVHGHARTLALLAPSLTAHGVDKTRHMLVEIMAQMDRQFPGNREKSLYASVELSLRRLSPENRKRARVLGVFQGGVQLTMLQQMMQWEASDVNGLAQELIATGLATRNSYDHLSLNPALCPYLRRTLDTHEYAALIARWSDEMIQYVEFLVREHGQNTEVAATLTRLELSNLFALLERLGQAGDAEATIALATSLYRLLQNLGKPRLLERVGQVRDAAVAQSGETWNHAQFNARRTRIEQQEAGGQLREALDGAQALLEHARTLGEQAYPDADYDLAGACFLLARVLNNTGGAEPALLLLDEARQRSERFEQQQPGRGAQGMTSACISERGACLLYLGRFDEAAAAYEEAIPLNEQRGDKRAVAVGKGQLGTVRLAQHRYAEALAAFKDACDQFTRLDEPGSVAVIWHQTGLAYQEAGQRERAEQAYRESLAINVRLGNVAGQAGALLQLGNLYGDVLGRTKDDAVELFSLAANKFTEIHDIAKEGVAMSNLANHLRKLHRLDKARDAIRRAIKCKAPFGHVSQPWTSWAILADIESEAGNPVAAAEAKAKALEAYLAYRGDGGENHDPDGRIALAVTRSLLAGDPAAAESLLREEAPLAEAAGFPSFIPALQAIAAGSRDPRLADAADLSYSMAAEILLLIDTLNQAPVRE